MSQLSQHLDTCDQTAGRRITYGRQANDRVVKCVVEHAPSIRFDCFKEEDVITFVDTSWGTRPIQCALVVAFGSYISGRVTKIEAATLSTCEAEWYGATMGTTMLMALGPVFDFLGIKPSKPSLIFCDNKSACMLSNSNHSTKRMRHVAIRLAFLQEQVDNQVVRLVHIGTTGNVADIGTKPLPAQRFHDLAAILWTTEV